MAETSKYFPEWQSHDFDTSRKEYNPQIAWWLVYCSKLAYENKITVAKYLKTANFEKVIFFDNQGSQAFLAKHPGVKPGQPFAVLAFRGTENDSIDILTDINFVSRLFPNENIVEEVQSTVAESKKNKPPGKNLYAHGGFLQGVENIWGCALRDGIKQNFFPGEASQWLGSPGISNAICELKDTPLYITGHSLGGALATLAAYKAEIYELDGTLKIGGIYTFGSPRAVQFDLANKINNYFGDRSYRVVNSIDVVPRVPLRIPPVLYFKHIHHLVYFNSNRQVILGRENSFALLLEDISVILSVLIEVGLSFFTFGKYIPVTIKKHMIDEYIEDIETSL